MKIHSIKYSLTNIASVPFVVLVFSTTVSAEDHGDTLSTATAFVGDSMTGILETANDQDWFRIEVAEGGRVWMYSTGTTDTAGELFDHVGNDLSNAWRDDDGGDSYNFKLGTETASTGVLTAGIYYLQVTGGDTSASTGAYTVSIRTHDNASSISTAGITGNLEERGEIDLYQFTVDVPGRVWIYSTGSTDTDGKLFDHTGDELGGTWSNDDGGDSYNFHLGTESFEAGILSVGTYYLRVQAGDSTAGVGAYNLYLRSFENAIHLDEPDHIGALGELGNVNLYRFDISERGRVWIYTTGTTDTAGSLFDHTGKELGGSWSDDNGGASYNFQLGEDSFDIGILAAGTFYLRIGAGQTSPVGIGPYELHIRQPATAHAVLNSGDSNHKLELLGEHHLFAFNTSGGTVSLASTGETDTRATLFDSFWDPVATDDNNGDNRNFSITETLTRGMHYLVVRGALPDTTTGSYDLDAEFPSGPLTRLSAASVLVSNEESVSLDVSSNTDWEIVGLPSWVSAPRESGQGSDSLTFALSPNTSGTRRSATLSVGGIPYTLSQNPMGSPLGTLYDPPVNIHPAVIITLQTEAGARYKIETSIDLEVWQDTGISVFGDGSVHAITLERSAAREHFRARSL